jgi:aminopeptidase N
VAVEARAPGGHSPPALVYVQERPAALRGQAMAEDPANFSDVTDFFIAHELAHQWFGQGAAPAGYRERWLSEAWAQYAAALWIRHRQGESAFRDTMGRMAHWAMRHDDAGPIHLGQRLGALEGDSRLYRAVVYDKGAWVLHMLRGIVGDDAFFAGTRAFLEGHRYEKVVTADLREALERASGRDLRAYFERWVNETGLPRLSWSARTQKAQGGYETTIAMVARDAPGPLPVEIALSTSAGKEVHRVTLEPPSGSWTITSAEKPHGVSVNEDRGLLARVDRERSVARAQR